MHLKWDESYVENLAYSPFKKAQQKDTLTQICTWNERMQRNDGKASLVVGDHEAWEWVASEAWKNGQSLNSDIKEYSPGRNGILILVNDHGEWRHNMRCLVGIRMSRILSKHLHARRNIARELKRNTFLFPGNIPLNRNIVHSPKTFPETGKTVHSREHS